MAKFLLGALLGLIVGGVLAFYLFAGAPRSAKAPGAPIKPPDAAGSPPATATVVLKQDFFNTVLQTIFRDMNAPAFPLGLTGAAETNNSPATAFGLQQQSGCDGKIVLKPEGSGAQTALRFDNNQITAPLAFSGTYNVPVAGCLNFTGWAEANLDLRFDEQSQTVFGQINVQTVNLDGITPLASGLVTPLVQSTINQKINPIQILRGDQIALNVPIAATDGMLQARVKDVRAEVKDNALNLYVTYNFNGTRGGASGQPAAQ